MQPRLCVQRALAPSSLHVCGQVGAEPPAPPQGPLGRTHASLPTWPFRRSEGPSRTHGLALCEVQQSVQSPGGQKDLRGQGPQAPPSPGGVLRRSLGCARAPSGYGGDLCPCKCEGGEATAELGVLVAGPRESPFTAAGSSVPSAVGCGSDPGGFFSRFRFRSCVVSLLGVSSFSWPLGDHRLSAVCAADAPSCSVACLYLGFTVLLIAQKLLLTRQPHPTPVPWFACAGLASEISLPSERGPRPLPGSRFQVFESPGSVCRTSAHRDVLPAQHRGSA